VLCHCYWFNISSVTVCCITGLVTALVDNVMIILVNTTLLISFAYYNTTCFGPTCGSSSSVSRSQVIQGTFTEVPKSRYVGIYLWIALGNYGTEIFLILRFLEVSHATVP